MRLPPLNALRAFEAAARHESIARAADELCVTQGAVSRHVKLLEEELGVSLFRRLPRGIELTAHGRRFLPILTNAFESIAVGARQIGNAKRDLRIICPPSFSIRWLIPRLEHFRERHPDITLAITTAMYDWDDFYSGDFDLGFACGFVERPPGLQAITVLPEVLTPVCSPAYLESASEVKSPNDLAILNLLHPTPDHRDWKLWVKAHGANAVDPMTGEVFPSLDMAVKAAVMGQGITMGDLVLIKEELETGKLVCPLADFSLRSEDDGMCLYGQGGCWDDPRSAAFKAWLMEMASKDRAPYNPSGG